MLDLLGLELGDGCGERRVAGAEIGELLRIVTVDLGLDRSGAGHRRFGRDQRGGGAEQEAGLVPQGRE